MAASERVGVDLGTTGGEWLFKQGDMLLGPVPARVLIDKLFRGEIDGRTPIAREGREDFVPIEEIDFFKLHVKKASVKVQIDRDTVSLRVKQSRSRAVKLGGFIVLAVLVLGAGAFGASWLAIHKPWRKADAQDLVTIDVAAPSISLAPGTPDEVAIALPVEHAKKAAPGRTRRRSRDGRRAPTPSANPQNASAADGVQAVQQFDSAAISQIAHDKSTTIYPCIMTEARAHPPAEPVTLPLEFMVGNDGRVGKVWVDNHDYGAGTPLYACIVRTLKTWRFPHYQGEQASVKLNFRWGRKH